MSVTLPHHLASRAYEVCHLAGHLAAVLEMLLPNAVTVTTFEATDIRLAALAAELQQLLEDFHHE